MSRCRHLPVFAVLSLALLPPLRAQQAPAAANRPLLGSNWESVKALPTNSRVHLTTDHSSRICRVLAVSDDTLTCAKGNTAGDAVPRPEIQRIKLTHYGRSALVGAGVGGGVGAISGAIAGRTKPCATNLCLNGILGPGAVAAIFGVGGAVVGGVVGFVTDFTRGTAIYTRT